MATKAKDHSNSTSTTTLAKKERLATTHSNSQAKTTSTKPSTTQGPSSSTHKSPSPSREKQVPNYLKPTISSLQEFAGPKPSVNKRRSFDNKLHPPSRASKVVPEKTVPSRSPPSSKGASKTTPRPTTKPQTLCAKSVKKGAECSIKNEGSSRRGANPKSSTKDKESAIEPSVHEVVDSDDVVLDNYHDDHSELIKVAPKDELKSKDNHEHESIDDHGHGHDQDQDHDHDHDHDQQDEIKANKLCDISIVSEEIVKADHDNTNSGIGETDHNKLENTQEEEKLGDHTEVHEEKEENQNRDESCTAITSEIKYQTEEGIENEEAKVEELVKEGVKEVVIEEIEELENKAINNGDEKEGTEEEEEIKSKEIVLGGECGEEEEQKAKSEGVVKRTQGGNKKESQVAYNDVIEETASKLLEKRKNKVKALVGAFETVIDHESAAK